MSELSFFVTMINSHIFLFWDLQLSDLILKYSPNVRLQSFSPHLTPRFTQTLVISTFMTDSKAH